PESSAEATCWFCDPREASAHTEEEEGSRRLSATAPASALAPYRSEAPPRSTSILSIAARGTLPHSIQPPKGSFNGISSSRTPARDAPLPPTPRSETPCAVGLAARLSVRRKSVKPGTL